MPDFDHAKLSDADKAIIKIVGSYTDKRIEKNGGLELENALADAKALINWLDINSDDKISKKEMETARAIIPNGVVGAILERVEERIIEKNNQPAPKSALIKAAERDLGKDCMFDLNKDGKLDLEELEVMKDRFFQRAPKDMKQEDFEPQQRYENSLPESKSPKDLEVLAAKQLSRP